MITIERKRIINAPVEQVRAILWDPAQIGLWMPRIERVEVLTHTEDQARLALEVRLPKLGAQRVESEVQLLEDGVRFIAVQPARINAHWIAAPHGENTEVTVRLALELPFELGRMARFIPQGMLEEQVAAELDRTMQRLEVAAGGPQTYT
jgi:uncharacterized protein YndB with AHSA1/START domain